MSNDSHSQRTNSLGVCQPACKTPADAFELSELISSTLVPPQKANKKPKKKKKKRSTARTTNMFALRSGNHG